MGRMHWSRFAGVIDFDGFVEQTRLCWIAAAISGVRLSLQAVLVDGCDRLSWLRWTLAVDGHSPVSVMDCTGFGSSYFSVD
jgi:hypothetical protein